LEGLNKTSKNINHDSQSLARGLKPKPTGLRRARFIFKTTFKKKSDEDKRNVQFGETGDVNVNTAKHV
jgi:hypothetical protein